MQQRIARLASVLAAAALVVVGCGARGGESAEPLLPAEVKALYDQGEVTVVDVRARDDFAACHIPGSLNIPFGSLDGRLGEVPTDKQVIFVCSSGPVSRSALERVRERGFEDANNM
jgi:hydroxyacylglutathione hydrolase